SIASVISATTYTIFAPVAVAFCPIGAAYDSARGEVFVTNFGSNTVSVISDSTNAVVATMPVQSGPIGVAYDSVRGEVFVASVGFNTVSVISDSTTTIVALVSVHGTETATYDAAKDDDSN